jgi:MFS family permease
VFGLFWGGWGALVPAVKAQTGATQAELGLALLLVAAGALPAMLSSGWIIDRFQGRTLSPATAVFGLAVVLPGLAHSVPALSASLVVVGAASGALDVTMNAAVAAEESRRGVRLMHAAHAVFSGSVVVASVSVGLARAAGAEVLPIVATIGGVVLAGAVAIRAGGGGPLPGEARIAAPLTGRRLHLTTTLVALGGLGALAYLVENALQSWSALHLEQTLGAGPAVGGLGPGLFAAGAAMGRLSAQWVAARTADRLLLGVSATLGGAGTLVAALAPSPGLALIGVFLAGASISVAAPTIFSLSGRAVATSDRGRAMATVTTIAYLGFLLGPPLVGAIAGAAGLRLALSVVAAFALALAALASRAPVAPAR